MMLPRAPGNGVWVLAGVWLTVTMACAQTPVPSTFVLPSSAADMSQPGFVWRVHEVTASQGNDNVRTEDELAGLLGVNVADPNAQGVAIGPAAPADPTTAPITFGIGTVVNMSAVSWDIYTGNFVPDDPMPGLPGLTGSYENAAGEILTWLELPAGTVTLGVNSDDGFRMTLGGANPIDRFAAAVGEFNGGRGAADTLFTFTIAQAGLYAARCIWENGCCGANIEMFSIQPDGSRVLLNDTAIGGLRAYRAVTAPARAYARKVSPGVGGAAAAASPILVELVDGASPVDPATVKMAVDGTWVVPAKGKSGNVTTITYSRPTLYSSGAHSVAFVYTEAGTPVTVNWTFTTLDYEGPNGNFYEIVPARNISWADANAAAEQRAFGCAHGHLVTLTSAEEDVFVELLRQRYFDKGVLGSGTVWAGGYQLPNQAGRNEGWFWVNNEGPIAPDNSGPTYANWNLWSGEPNDCCNTWGFEDDEEDFLGIGYYGPGAGWIDDDVGHGNVVGYVVEYERIPVAIDIKPGGVPNPIQLDATGKLPVAILSTAGFSATTVDPSTVRFGRTGIEAAPVSFSFSDVNGDKRKDLVCQFNIQDTAFLCGDTVGLLRARTTTGCPLGGSDSVQILGCPSYALAIQPLLDVNHLTDVYLQVSPILPGHTAPTVAKNVVLKSMDIFGYLRWNRTAQNLPLAPIAGGRTLGDLQYTDVEHGQNIKVQMQVVDSATGSAQLLRQEGRVLYRPDLAVTSVNAPGEIPTHHIVNIVASIAELKGDLGATATVYLMDGDSVIDQIPSISLPPLGTVGVTFATIFQTVGPHQLKVVIADVGPGDYDLSNNEQSFSIQVIEPPLAPVSYCTSYYQYSEDAQSVVENPFWIYTYSSQYTNEYASETLYIPASFRTAIGRVTLQLTVDSLASGNYEALAIPINLYYDDGCYTYQSGFQTLGNGVYFYVDTYSDCYGNQISYATFTKYYYANVYFSSTYDKVWQTTSQSSYSYQDGTPLAAMSTIEARFIVEGDAGAFGGNGYWGPLYTYPFDYSFDYYQYDYNTGLYDEHVTGSTRGRNTFGGICDVTIP